MKAIILILFLMPIALTAQLIADAGGDRHFCTYPDSLNQLIIGGSPTATGGVEPYTYEWSIEPFDLYPGSSITIITSYLLDDSTLANPSIIDFGVRKSFTFRLRVIDAIGQESYDSCIITFSAFAKLLAYYEFHIPSGDSIFLSYDTNVAWGFDNDSLTYEWFPGETLSNPHLSTDFWAFPDTTTWYYVKVTDRFGCVAQGDPYYHIVVHTVGIEKSEKSEISIFPNPVKDVIYIENNNGATIDEFKISDISGKVIMREQQSYGMSFIDVSKLPPGLYILSFYGDGKKIYETKIAMN